MLDVFTLMFACFRECRQLSLDACFRAVTCLGRVRHDTLLGRVRQDTLLGRVRQLHPRHFTRQSRLIRSLRRFGVVRGGGGRGWEWEIKEVM
jgi:hypothetical protein